MRLAVFVLMLWCCPAWAAAQAAPDLSRAEALVRDGRAAEAYTLLEPFEFDHSGNASFDYWLGVAALESGRPDKATLALERALIVDPDFLGARLDLARAYFALGDMDRARTEFNLVLAQSPPPPARVTIERYLGEIENKTQAGQIRWSAYLEATIGHDSNVNSATSRGLVFVPIFGLDLTLSRTSVRTQDNYFHVGGGVELTQPLVGGLSVFGGLDYRRRLHLQEDTFDYSQFDGRIGLQYQENRELFRGAFTAGEYRLDNRRHYESTGFNAEWRHAFDENSVASVFGVFNALRFPNPDLRGNSADQRLAGVGWLRSFNPDRTTYVFASAYGGRERDTDQRIDGERDLLGVRVIGQYNLFRQLDAYLIAATSLSKYDTENVLFQVFRRDQAYELTGGLIWHVAKNWTVRPQVSYVYTHSNIAINEFSRYDISITLRREFR